ncbi:NAD-glutamate dehydrogenase [Eikenella sp. Marseille-P7795]|uniref:NAD-glutamate dehydrogenase n=1 Tax=Eikenella sp. Marseille-P7795 TaxID=2866577 RepID=UPI001CE40D52|nr:NAD-glutamate dehydrogenase [Eikenella sp. Marseille-P7795]
MSLPAPVLRLQDCARQQNFTEDFPPFLAGYYRQADFADLARYSDDALVAAADSHRKLAQEPRAAGKAVVRVSPTGDAVQHTLVEIVADDTPFLLDSLLMLLNREQRPPLAVLHSVWHVKRSDNGQAAAIQAEAHEGSAKETLAAFYLEGAEAAQDQELAEKIRLLLAELGMLAASEHKLRGQLLLVNQMILNEGRSHDAEIVSFLSWLADRNFLLMGFCEYDLVSQSGSPRLQPKADTAQGILTQNNSRFLADNFAALSDADKKQWLHSDRLLLDRSSHRSRIHRPAYYNLIGIQKLNASGQVIGQWCFIGLYTAPAYTGSIWDIPVLRRKAEHALKHFAFEDGSHNERQLRHLLQTYPRDELFETGEGELVETLGGLLALSRRPRTRLFARADLFKRYVSVLCYLPKEQFDSRLCQRIAGYLKTALAAESCEFAVQLADDSALACVPFLCHTNAARLPAFHSAKLEQHVARLVENAEADNAAAAAPQPEPAAEAPAEPQQAAPAAAPAPKADKPVAHAEADGAFSAAYREAFGPEQAIADLKHAAQLSDEQPVVATFGAQDNPVAPYAFRLYTPLSPSLSQTLPLIENMGLSVHTAVPYTLYTEDAAVGLTHFSAAASVPVQQAAEGGPAAAAELPELFAELWAGRVENDRFNALVLAAGISWRNSVLLRAIAKYLKQATLPFSQERIEQTLIRHGAIAAKLADLFAARLHPEEADDNRALMINSELTGLLADVPSLDDERIINAFRAVILAVCRTNFWQTDEAGYLKPEISLKIKSKDIPFLPKPHPMYEIWVYSPRVEGIHLRGSKVARGGLRWSDRFDDFRTEVLGLVKAQMVKNAVIVPSGSKGGFVCKQLPDAAADREGYLKEGVACYRIFINALLDLTDNRTAEGIEPPPQLHRRDGDDPYLVVAADKGTASFSDTANALAAEHGFWLDDAFASGGSAGYDHKGMGITARGAWESVKRHFRHLGKDIQNEDFTVVGIGDMGGDVFGNGMLLSEHIRLQAAFNHRHIFIDPNPNAAKSFDERKRLFQSGGSWEKYSRSQISQGGGVYERSAKSIAITPEVKAWLGIEAESLTPNELIRELLKADVELLYNGGIGTYIKAEAESHADARDKANDEVRVNGSELRAKVLGEGGNLGATQLGRIEYWQNGGRCCTDAIDNSAGVDCSDHEVNIKILLGEAVRAGRLPQEERDELLKQMTAEVAQLVLQDNYLQTQALSVAQLNPSGYLKTAANLIGYLEEHAALDRAVEFLPDAAEIQRRAAAGQGLSNPEVAVLLSYSKMHCQDAILGSDIPDDPNFLPALIRYFPAPLQQQYGTEMQHHYLKREIIASQLANRIINRMGPHFIQRCSEENQASVANVVRAYWLADILLDGEARFQAIQAFDNRLPAEAQMRLIADVAELISHVAGQLLRNRRPFGNLGSLITQYRAQTVEFMQQLPARIQAEEHPSIAEREARLSGYGVLSAQETAELARLPFAANVLAVVDLAADLGKPVETVAKAYFMLSERLNMSWIYRAIAKLPRGNQWQGQACLAIYEDATQIHLDLTRDFLQAGSNGHAAAKIAAARSQIADMQQYEPADLSMLAALVRNLSKIANPAEDAKRA